MGIFSVRQMFKERAENAMYDMIEKSDWMLHVITGLKLMGNLTASVKYGSEFFVSLKTTVASPTVVEISRVWAKSHF